MRVPSARPYGKPAATLPNEGEFRHPGSSMMCSQARGEISYLAGVRHSRSSSIASSNALRRGCKQIEFDRQRQRWQGLGNAIPHLLSARMIDRGCRFPRGSVWPHRVCRESAVVHSMKARTAGLISALNLARHLRPCGTKVVLATGVNAEAVEHSKGHPRSVPLPDERRWN